MDKFDIQFIITYLFIVVSIIWTVDIIYGYVFNITLASWIYTVSPIIDIIAIILCILLGKEFKK